MKRATSPRRAVRLRRGSRFAFAPVGGGLAAPAGRAPLIPPAAARPPRERKARLPGALQARPRGPSAAASARAGAPVIPTGPACPATATCSSPDMDSRGQPGLSPGPRPCRGIIHNFTVAWPAGPGVRQPALSHEIGHPPSKKDGMSITTEADRDAGLQAGRLISGQPRGSGHRPARWCIRAPTLNALLGADSAGTATPAPGRR